jgi:hypothetical protein
LWTFRHHFGSHQPFRRHHQFFGKQPNIITYLCIVYVYIYTVHLHIVFIFRVRYPPWGPSSLDSECTKRGSFSCKALVAQFVS